MAEENGSVRLDEVLPDEAYKKALPASPSHRKLSQPVVSGDQTQNNLDRFDLTKRKAQIKR